jgi:hypothetical protein
MAALVPFVKGGWGISGASMKALFALMLVPLKTSAASGAKPLLAAFVELERNH